jgi:hypothetical protein
MVESMSLVAIARWLIPVYFAIRDFIHIFIRRNSEEAVELATIDMPDELRDHFLESVGGIKGVYAISDEIKAWLEKELYAHWIERRRKMSKRKYMVRAECPQCACGDVSFLGPEKLREKFIGDEKEMRFSVLSVEPSTRGNCRKKL